MGRFFSPGSGPTRKAKDEGERLNKDRCESKQGKEVRSSYFVGRGLRVGGG